MQHRASDMTTFFSHKNHPFPANGGKLHLGKKSDLLTILVQDPHFDPPESIDVKFLDGAVVVYLLSVTNIANFDECANQIFSL